MSLLVPELTHDTLHYGKVDSVQKGLNEVSILTVPTYRLIAYKADELDLQNAETIIGKFAKFQLRTKNGVGGPISYVQNIVGIDVGELPE